MRHYSCLICCLLLVLSLEGQDLPSLRAAAQVNLENGRYAAALEALQTLHKAQPNRGEVLTQMGHCYLEMGNLDKARQYLEQGLQIDNSDLATNFLHLARLHHAQLDFAEAATAYKKFLRLAPADHPQRAGVRADLLRCANGLHLQRLPPAAAVVALSPPVNSTGDEFSPTVSAAYPGRLFFAYTQARTENTEAMRSDLYYTDLQNGDWGPPAPVSIFLNTTQHEVPETFDEQGKQLYFFRGETLFSGDLKTDSLRKNSLEGTLFVPTFDGPVNARQGDQDPYFFTDSILLFASRREGGYGGLDLYVSTRRQEGWSVPENLGPVINSAFDETSPFLAADGRTLYFSTNDARRSLGGLDIMRSVFLDRSHQWIPAENLGLPFNSAADDEGFRLSPEGNRAFFDSARKQGLGERDLYVGIFKQAQKEQLTVSQPVAFHLVPAPTPDDPGPARPATVPPGTLDLRPLRFPAPNMPLTDESFERLQALAAALQQNPQVRVVLAAHLAPADDRSAGDAALQLALEALTAAGVGAQNLLLRNVGAAFPAGTAELADNRRIDVFVANPEALSALVYLPEAPASQAGFFQKTMERLVFQITAPLSAEQPLSTLLASAPEGAVLLRPATGQRFFATGNYLTWDAAQQALTDLLRQGVEGASITPFLRGWPLNEEEAAALVSDFPQLEFFLKK